MKVLLDTHTLIWALSDNPNLSENARNIILDENNVIYVSIASLWEIDLKSRKGKIWFSSSDVTNWSVGAGFIFLSIGYESINNIKTLSIINEDKISQDPFDQLLLSQAKTNDMKFLTHDKKFKYFNEPNVIYF